MPMDIRRIPRKPKLLICPYDPVHRVEEGTRFQSHLIECAKNHPEIQEVVCEFNRTHRIKITDYQFHLLNCPDNYVVKKDLITVNNEFTRKPQPEPLETYEPVPSSEDWEEEALPEPFTIPTYSNLNNKSIKFVNPDQLTGMKPRHKKKFRKNLKIGIKLQFNDDDSEEDEETEVKEETEEIVQKSDIQAEKMNAQTKNQNSRTPSEIPAAAVPVLHLLNAGRGLNPALRPSRIAANIYSGINASPEFTSASSLASAGIGRGQLFGLKPIHKGKVTETKQTSLPLSGQMDDAEEDHSGLASERKTMDHSEDNTFEDYFKIKRKLEKKLKQIEILEKKKNDGIESLNEDETKKLNTKNQIIDELRKYTDEKIANS